jgi:hypothetical protein
MLDIRQKWPCRQVLHRLLLGRWLGDLLLYLSLLLHVVAAHGLERVVGVHHLQAVRDAAMCCCH